MLRWNKGDQKQILSKLFSFFFFLCIVVHRSHSGFFLKKKKRKGKGMTDPTNLPRDVRLYRPRASRDPLRLLDDRGEVTPWTLESKLLYDDHNVHPFILTLLARESSGDPINVKSYQHGETVNLTETTAEQLRSLPLRLLFGALNTTKGYLSKKNALSSCFKIVFFGSNSYRNFFFYSEKEYSVKTLNLGTLRSLAPSLRNREAKCSFEFHERSVSVPLDIEAIMHGDRRAVNAELANRFKQVEGSLFRTINHVLCCSIANPPTLLDDVLAAEQDRYKAVSHGKDPAPNRWFHDILLRQMEYFCPSQFKAVGKTGPIVDCIRQIRRNTSEDDDEEYFVFTTAAVAEMIADGETTTEPRSMVYFYPERDEDDDGKPISLDMFRVYEGLDRVVAMTLPFVNVEGAKVPIVKIPSGAGSPFEQRVTAIVTAPLGYLQRRAPRVQNFRNVDLSKVRVTSFRRTGSDATFDFQDDVVRKSGLYHPLTYDPVIYESCLRSLPGSDEEDFAKMYAAREFHGKALSEDGIRPTDPEFLLCNSPHVLYTGRSFGATANEGVDALPTRDDCRFRLVGVEGNRPLCSAEGYLESACTVVATTDQIDETVEEAFVAFLEASLAVHLRVEDLAAAVRMVRQARMVEALDHIALSDDLGGMATIDDPRRKVLVDLFLDHGGSGAAAGSKWMQFPRLGIALLRMASLDRFDAAFKDRLDAALLDGPPSASVSQESFLASVARLKKVDRAVRTFAGAIIDVYHRGGETQSKSFSFCDLPCVVPTHNIPTDGNTRVNECDVGVDERELMIWRFVVESVYNFLATDMFVARLADESEMTSLGGSGSSSSTITGSGGGGGGGGSDRPSSYPSHFVYPHRINVGGGRRRVEWHYQPYHVEAFYTTANYDANEAETRRMRRISDEHPLFGLPRRGQVTDGRLQNFYHSFASRVFYDLSKKNNLSMALRCLAAAMCLRVHAPENARAVPSRTTTHSSALIVRHGEFATDKLVVAKMNRRGGGVEGGFVGLNPPCLIWDKSANGSLTARLVVRLGPVIPDKQQSMRQIPHYCTTACSRGMGGEMADVHSFLDGGDGGGGGARLPDEFWMEQAIAVPTPSNFPLDPFDADLFPINGRFSLDLGNRRRRRCCAPDPFHTLPGGYSYNPFAHSCTPSLMTALNYAIALRKGPALPPWNAQLDQYAERVASLRRQFDRLVTRTREMRVDTAEDPNDPETHIDWGADAFLAQRGRFYHPGSATAERGRTVFGDDENSTLNWRQLLHPDRRTTKTTTGVRPLDEDGIDLAPRRQPYRTGLR